METPPEKAVVRTMALIETSMPEKKTRRVVYEFSQTNKEAQIKIDEAICVIIEQHD
ncbi:ParB family protein [Photorhabdus aballayi]|uniref:ParB family protein n=1 Tax=Photorhabdus TaxID=29487 RepID=UPI00223CB123|nr:ParB family protein [Photorhabdus aballayi]MCW7550008.1 hypothetical protein [Photorhabdus aballayi]